MRYLWMLALLGCTEGGGKDPVDDTDIDVGPVDNDFDGVPLGRDCNDANSTVFPGAAEICDGLDNDCDQLSDEEDPGLDRTSAVEYFADEDRDGFGAASLGFYCEQPRRTSTVAGDCDDSRETNFPGNAEICDDRDNDCDGLVDVDDADLSLDVGRTWFTDADGDGFGDPAMQIRTCERPDGAVNNGNDCDDGDARQWTNNVEVCDGFDQDCDGLVDDADPTVDPATLSVFYRDTDGDGWGTANTLIAACELPAGFVVGAGDCDDAVPSVNPDGQEICGGLDEDCDLLIDAADPSFDPSVAPTWYDDADGDGYGDPTTGVQSCVQTPGAVASPGDCNDAEPLAWTNAIEICDAVDNDCDLAVDDADPGISPALLTAYAVDADGDGHGSEDAFIFACFEPANTPAVADDCNDADPLAWTGNTESCDGSDNDCNGAIDDGALNGVLYYQDVDADGFGDPGAAILECTPPVGYVRNADDCDDLQPSAWTGAQEICDGIDNDCDALLDDRDPGVDLVGQPILYDDVDGDGDGDASTAYQACASPAGAVRNGSDCNDGDPDVNTRASEVCDQVDNDCDRAIDQADPTLDASTLSVWYPDADQDGFGDASTAVLVCTAPAGSVAVAGDCDDGADDRYPGNAEVCDQRDNDCNTIVDDGGAGTQTWYADEDGDGRGDPSTGVETCAPPDGAVAIADDCDDAEPLAWVGNPEVCDGADNDCSGGADDADPLVDDAGRTTFYADIDEDSYGNPNVSVRACVQPPGLVLNGGDCADSEPLAWTGNTEVCDGVDNDCAGGTDDADPNVDPASQDRYFVDGDGDGRGFGPVVLACEQPRGTVSVAGDCDDAEPLAWTDAPEVCDGGVDNDCSGSADDADPGLELASTETFYADADRDGRGSLVVSFQRCVIGAGMVAASDDCNDAEPLAWVGNPEVCDGVDNDCVRGADDADPTVDLSTGRTFYQDVDRDGFGALGSPVRACAMPATAVADSTDCDDRSNVVFPGANEVCDSVDNDCDRAVDAADGDIDYEGRRWFTDADRDGYGTGGGVQTCTPAANTAPLGGDCDERNAAVNPGEEEICDNLDNDCDAVVDTDLWWDPAWPYRVFVTVEAPAAYDLAGAPVSVDIDFEALLGDLGDASGLNGDSVRVVHQACDFGVPELPSEYMDDVTGVFDQIDLVDPVGDDRGAVAFLYDEDGDYGTREPMARGTTATFAVYFGSNANGGALGPAMYASGLTASSDGAVSELSNDWTESSYTTTFGGVSDRLGPVGRDTRVGSQSSTLVGNGMFLGPVGGGAGGAWISARRGTGATTELLHAGPVFGAVRGTGTSSNAYGGFEYTYTYFLFEGRPEVYAKVSLVLDRASHLGPIASGWTSAVRPMLIDNLNIVGASNGEEGARDAVGFSWVRGTYDTLSGDPYGLAMGFRRNPSQRASPVYANDGRWLGLIGQDYTNAAVGTEIDLPAGTRVADEMLFTLFPHEGTFAAVSDEFYAVLAGVEAFSGDAEAR